ncbi:MAG: 30S ribosomal protein S17 [Mycobacterium sp.]|nr:30S ribosomal protein S17 [Mycobacterium sp.]
MAEAKTGSQAAAKTTASKAAPSKAAKSAPKADAAHETQGGATPGDDAGRQRPAEKPGNGRGPKHTPRTPKPRGRRKTRIGYVVSDKMQKTIVVELEDRMRHPLYGKIIRTTKKVKAHDENGVAGIGDRVSLMETRPLSATKRWRLVAILEKAK